MKQSILFEQGKLYVVELPEKSECCPTCNYEHDQFVETSLANKVEVKNPEFVTSTYFGFVKLEYGKGLKDGDTFPIPDGIQVVKNDCSDTATCKCKIVCKKPTVSLVLKRIEPEKSITISGGYEPIRSEPEKPEEYGMDAALTDGIEATMASIKPYSKFLKYMQDNFTIQRRKINERN